ncbi:tRNA lysidine(34) synthetase TilS [Mycoplasmopsis ciconiae]|uniref:tRNA(Ile)-lysidine synthase n=1 Tax=Mycoplasmopsis ciconiae TaxID=561067 RepID=A0ABU7ML78_9BACT|nr:tRNA lysidine(34) synthetase TilS [Mycoplasmopsis ciconiae]
MLKKQKALFAVSGGPDSMFMLDKLKNKYSTIVACVNYNVREESDYDFNIVKDYCKKNNIPFYGLIIDKNEKHIGNFQAWAREKRYNFFKSIYEQQNCSKLLIAHHLDDFIESYHIQKQHNRIINYLGIKKKNIYKNMNIYRPFLYKYTKQEIENLVIKKNIPYAVDVSNQNDKYLRNKIRKSTFLVQKKSKLVFLVHIKLMQTLQNIKNIPLNMDYRKWKNKNFSQDTFSKLKNKEKLIYRFITENFDQINLTKGKLEMLKKFILSKNRTSKYLLKENIYLFKNKGELVK